jgi:hypothetical protein
VWLVGTTWLEAREPAMEGTNMELAKMELVKMELGGGTAMNWAMNRAMELEATTSRARHRGFSSICH